MQGTSGTFAFNGVELLLQPSEHRWMERELVGNTGNARAIYPRTRKYELRWDLIPMDVFNQLQEFFNGIQTSGSIVADLPKYATTPYQFYSYSGCQIQEPTVGNFFMDYVSDVSLLILKVTA